MPLYGYSCLNHGSFEAFAPASECGEKRRCPTCEKPAGREYSANVGLVTDTSLFTTDKMDQIAGGDNPRNNTVSQHFRKMADDAGVVTRGKQYMSQLARYPGDPRAWVSSRGDVKRIAEQDNLNVTDEGLGVKHKAEKVAPQAPGLAEDLARKYAKQIQRNNPGMSAEKALNEAVEKHAPPGHKRIIKAPKKRMPYVPKIGKIRRK